MRLTRPLLFVLPALMTVGLAAGQSVVNEGSGSRRAQLDAMVYQSAPISVILDAQEWIGEAPSAASLSGKPVLVFTWAEWYRPSHAVAMLGKRLADEFAGDGLVVIGVHDEEGWDEAKRFASQRKLGYPIARDTGGAIREALRVDQDPDIYVIDRAGNLRYADIATDSARQAARNVVGEDTDAAMNVQDRLAAAANEAERTSRLPSGISNEIDLNNLPSLPFATPTAEEYQRTPWPKQTEPDDRRRRGDDSGPTPLALPAEGWYRGRSPATNGKVLVVYNWHPADRDSMDRLMFRMDDLQRRHARDVVVVGVMPPFSTGRRSRNAPENPIANVPITPDTIERYIGNREIDQYLVASAGGTPIPSRSRRNEPVMGGVAVVSTDGMVRRLEHWSEWDDIRRALDTVLRVDPGVKARRAAEDAYIRGRR